MKKILFAVLLAGCVDSVDKNNLPTIIQLPKLSTVTIVEDTVMMSAEEYRWLQNNRYTMEQWIRAVSEEYVAPTYVKISGAPYGE